MSAVHTSAPTKSKLERIAFLVVLTNLWIVMTLFGAIVMETLMVYPNVFADPPESLELSMDFFSIIGPGDFFRPLGMACWIVGGAALALTVRMRNVRWWIALGLAALVAEGIVSMLFFWPRNEIMFVEGLSAHSAEYLQEIARQFQDWHWLSRMAFNTIGAVAAFVGFQKLYKNRVLAQAERRAYEAREAQGA